MKMKIPFLAITATVFLAGWNKSPQPEQPLAVDKKLSRSTLKNNLVITYHANGKPGQVSWTAGGSRYVKTFRYGAGKISYVVTSDQQVTEQGEFTVENSRLTNLEWINMTGKQQQQHTERFEYNENGLLQTHYFDKSRTEYEHDKAGNLVRLTHFNAAGQPTTQSSYTYTKYKDRSPFFGHFTNDGSGFFLPAFSTQLPATRRVVKMATGETTLNGSFEYELDPDGYIRQAKWNAVSPGDPDFAWTNEF